MELIWVPELLSKNRRVYEGEVLETTFLIGIAVEPGLM